MIYLPINSYLTSAFYLISKLLIQNSKEYESYKKYIKKTNSALPRFSTLLKLKKKIQKFRPKFIIEFGTGASTIFICEVIKEIQKKNKNYKPKFISIESKKEWFDKAIAFLPRKYIKDVEIILSETKEIKVNMFRGIASKNIPEYPYEFIFIDGPDYHTKYGSSFCADILNVLKLSPKGTLRGVVDCRVSTCYVLQQIFGKNQVKFSPISKVGTINISSKKISSRLISNNFKYGLNGQLFLK